MRVLILALVALLSIACSQSSTQPTAVPTAPQPVAITYAINIPIPVIAQQLTTQYPNGVSMAPLDAQRAYDYTCQYQGAPNVYWGPVAPPSGIYTNVGILVAPADAASKLTFTGADWPAINTGHPATQPYTWTGLFAYAQPYNGLQPYGVCPR